MPVAPVQVLYQPPPWVQVTTPVPPSQVDKGPEEWVLPSKVHLGKCFFGVARQRSHSRICQLTLKNK